MSGVKIFFVSAFAVGLAVFNGCAPSIRLEVTKPAEVNMKGAKILAVMDYGFPIPNKSMNATDLLAAAFSKLIGLEVQEKETPESKVAKCATGKTSAVLAGTHYFTVLTPSDLSKALAGESDKTMSAVDIGKKAGAQSIVLGDIERLTLEDVDFTESYKQKDGSTTTEYKVRRKVNVQLSYRVIATETGGILATKTLNGFVQQVENARERSSLGSKEVLGCQAIENVIPEIAKQLAPYKVIVKRTLLKDKSKNPEFDRALSFMKGNMYGNAYDIFAQIYKTSGNVAAGFNAAIMKEAMGDVEAAYNEMNDIATKTADPKAIGEVQRLKISWEEQKKALSQM
jgi:hypothetical protein